jgi:hypothetical protein
VLDRLYERLRAGSPGTITAPESPPLRVPSRVSSTNPPRAFFPGSDEWQA